MPPRRSTRAAAAKSADDGDVQADGQAGTTPAAVQDEPVLALDPPADAAGGDTARDDAVAALNDAKLAVSGEAKVGCGSGEKRKVVEGGTGLFLILTFLPFSLQADHLAKLVEIACRRRPALLAELAPEVAALRAEPAAAARGGVADFCGAAARACLSLTPPSVAAEVATTCAIALADLAADASAAVAKRAAVAAAGAHADAVRAAALAGDSGAPDAGAACWAACEALRAAVLAAAGDAGRPAGARAAAFKAAEAAALTLDALAASPRVGAVPTKADAAAAAAATAAAVAAALGGPAAADLPGPVAVAAVRAAGTLATSAIALVNTVMPALIAAASTPPGSARGGAAAASVRAALAAALSAAARSPAPALVAWKRRLVPALREVGADEAADTLERVVGAPPAGEPAAKRARAEPPPLDAAALVAAAAATAAALHPTTVLPPPARAAGPPPFHPPPPPHTDPADLHRILSAVAAHASRPGGAPAVEAYIRSLPPAPLADAVLACCVGAPLPPPHGWGRALEGLAADLGIPWGPEMEVLRGPALRQPPAGAGGPSPRHPYGGPSPQHPGGFQQPPGFPGQHHHHPGAGFPKPEPKAEPAPAPVAAAAVVVPLAAPEMDARARRAARRSCYARLLRAPASEFRAGALARLAADEAPGDGLGDALLAALAAEGGLTSADGMDLVLRWLLALFAAEAVGGEGEGGDGSDGDGDADAPSTPPPAPPPGSRYDTALTATLNTLADAVAGGDPGKAASAALLGAPRLPPGAAAAFLGALAARGGPAATAALAAARDVALARPGARDEATAAVLDAATGLDPDLRSKAVRLVANRLLPEPLLADAIVARATEELEAGLAVEEPPKEEVVVEGEAGDADGAEPPPPTAASAALDAATRHVELYCALITRRPDLLAGLLSAFARATPRAPGRAAVLRLADGLARTLGPGAPALVDAVTAPCPAGAEALLLKLAYASTERAPAPPALAAALLAAHAATGDGRFLPPALGGLPRDRVLASLADVVWLDERPLRAALARALGARGAGVAGGPPAPAELLEALVTLDTGKKGGLARQRAAVNAALALPGAYGAPALAAALSRLLTRSPLPPLFMRLLIQALAAAPTLRPFVVETLGAVARRSVWATDAGAWRGWLLAARSASPDSFPALLALPPDVLASALRSSDGAPLRAPLTDYSRLGGCPVPVPPATRALLDELEREAAEARRAIVAGGG